MSNKRGKVIVLSGPSGVGKGTVCKLLLKSQKNLVPSVSATTRAPRVGEADGKNYFFVTNETFDRMLEEKAFLENFEIYGNRYGTPRQFVLDQVERGKNVILEIDVQGALRIKELMPEAKLIFLTPPGEDELLRRLTGRNSETEESLNTRFQSAKSEIGQCGNYDYCVVNDDLSRCVREVSDIIDRL